ncbi:MAG TPA: zinc-binding dehydrogenase, partial [Armatimonadota bacterium]
MSDILETYKKAEENLPEKILAWHLYGAGMENLGKDKKPEEVAMPSYGPGELLVRIDAVGICFSDIKVINQGNEHPRIKGRDLTTDPVILGHEPSVTVVGVGESLKDKYRIGQRFLVQPDVYYQGKSMAFGYVLPGAQTQYQVLTKELLNGDEGAYLIPMADSTGYAEGALTEAWACVVAAYRISHRHALKPGGILWIIGSPEDDGNYTLDMDITSQTVFATDVNRPLISELKELAASGKFELVETPQYVDMDLAAFESEYGLVDDIIVLGADADIIETVANHLGNEGVMNIVARESMSRPVKIDVGKVHYQRHQYIGTSGRSIGASYGAKRKQSELRNGGTAWFIGGAGPMGKMHVQLAMETAGGPSKILVTDVGAERLESATRRFAPLAASKGITFQAVNPNEMSTEDFNKIVDGLTDEQGFDDIVVMAPVGAIIANWVKYLAEEGLMNIFAGVPIGTIADIDLTDVYMNQIRFVGSSGSRLSDMQDTLKAAESGQLSSGTALAAIGGIEASWDGMLAVKELKYTGKAVIYPQIKGLELLSLAELKDRLPKVYAKLTNGEFWNNEAEAELLREML